MNKKIALISIIILFLGGFLLFRSQPQKNKMKKTDFKAVPEKYELLKDPRYLACVSGANGVIQKFSVGNEKMIQVTCKQIERMKIEDLTNSCLMGSIGLLHFIDQKEFQKLKGQAAIDWANKLFCQKYEKMLKK